MKNEITVPTTPNFIVCNGTNLHISKYSTEALKLIGDIWLANLIKKSRRMKGVERKFNMVLK